MELLFIYGEFSNNRKISNPDVHTVSADRDFAPNPLNLDLPLVVIHFSTWHLTSDPLPA